ncbi:hypothetical protein Droror1_Dr00012836 [Drosera rotundifolia]
MYKVQYMKRSAIIFALISALVNGVLMQVDQQAFQEDKGGVSESNQVGKMLNALEPLTASPEAKDSSSAISSIVKLTDSAPVLVQVLNLCSAWYRAHVIPLMMNPGKC